MNDYNLIKHVLRCHFNCTASTINKI